MTAEDFIDFSRKFIHHSGLGPVSPKYRKFASTFVLLPMALTVYFFVFYDFFYVKNDILKVAELLESIASYGQLLVRKFILLVHGNLIQNVIQEREKFWRYDLFGKNFGKFLRVKMIISTRVVQIMITLGSIIASLMCLSAILDGKKTPTEMWTPENPLLSNFFFIMQSFLLAETIYMVGAVDALFVLLSVDIKIQFLLLQKKLQSISWESQTEQHCLFELKTCTKHHNLLLRIHKKLNRIFSEYFLVQYVVSVIAACVQLYILMYITPSLEDMLKSIIYFGAVLFQVGMFFMPASDVEDEAEKFSAEIYNVNWKASMSKKIRQHILFMLMRAQKPLIMLGGGMIRINRNEYLVLFRLAFSISTLMGKMNENR